MTDDALAYDASDQATVDNEAKEAARRRAEDVETIRIWMSHPKGRDLLYRWIYHVCHLGQTFDAVDDQGRSDTHRTYLHLGERNIGAFIDGELRHHPELYMKMLEEQRLDNEARNSRLAKQNQRKGDGDD